MYNLRGDTRKTLFIRLISLKRFVIVGDKNVNLRINNPFKILNLIEKHFNFAGGFQCKLIFINFEKYEYMTLI